jgi:branched-chain amino acid transport system substrate-binding protein
VYFFLPGAMGINFIKQYVGAGLQAQITLISTGFSADQDIVAAVGEPMLNLVNTSHWAHDLPVPANRKFVAAFREEYGRLPTGFAAQAYDVIMALDAAIRATAGKVSDRQALLAAVRSARFESVRGPFSYNVNNFPVQNFYVRTVVKDPQLGLTNRLQGPILEKHADAYVSQCVMK